jgi:hypothetical protein
MNTLTDQPFLLLAVSFVALCLCAWIGAVAFAPKVPRPSEARQEVSTVLAASLTLLGLIIGFSFSMAIARYDLRNQYEESEASAISTAYLRADLLGEADASKVRQLLKTYLGLRIAFFRTRDADRLRQINEETVKTQRELWASLQPSAATRSVPQMMLVLSGMNEVFDFQGKTQAAWWNRIPTSAWMLMALIAILCNGLLGFSIRNLKGRAVFLVLPLLVSISFFLIADIDSPRGGGMIHTPPRDLLSVSSILQ